MKKLICFCVVIIMILSLVACGTSSTNDHADKISSNDEVGQETEMTSDDTMEQEDSSTTSMTTESETSTTSGIETTTPSTGTTEVKPLNERIICGECCFYGSLGNVEEVEISVLYQQFDELKCCRCGLVEGEDYKAGDYIYVIPE